jgi:hypothetical protein
VPVVPPEERYSASRGPPGPHPQSTFLPEARPAQSLAFIQLNVSTFERMTFGAVGSSGHLRGEALAPQNVLAMGHSLQVFRVDARPITAEMVYVPLLPEFSKSSRPS